MNSHHCAKDMEAERRLLKLICELPGMLCVKCALGVGEYLIESEGVPGDVVEFGCHRGRTGAFMAALTTKRVWLYDSFQGLPEKGPKDSGGWDGLKGGVLAASPKDVSAWFDENGLVAVIVQKWFKDVLPADLPEKIAFAHLDGDFYDSIMDSLNVVWPRISSGGYCLIHDYDTEMCPGVKPAVVDFFSGKQPPSRWFQTHPGQLCLRK